MLAAGCHHRVCARVLTRPAQSAPAGMTMQELMKDGRKGVKEIDGTLNRAEKLVEDTLQIGQQVRQQETTVCAAIVMRHNSQHMLPGYANNSWLTLGAADHAQPGLASKGVARFMQVACRRLGIMPYLLGCVSAVRCSLVTCCVLCADLMQTAATLHDQTQQLNKIVDDLNEIEFTMKKASKIIADIGKGIMTDR